MLLSDLYSIQLLSVLGKHLVIGQFSFSSVSLLSIGEPHMTPVFSSSRLRNHM